MRFLILVIVIILILTGCNAQEIARAEKDSESAKNGLNRKLEVYSHSGELLKTYSGKFDIEYSEEGGKIKFDLNNKRMLIYNAVVVCEEQ